MSCRTRITIQEEVFKQIFEYLLLKSSVTCSLVTHTHTHTHESPTHRNTPVCLSHCPPVLCCGSRVFLVTWRWPRSTPGAAVVLLLRLFDLLSFQLSCFVKRSFHSKQKDTEPNPPKPIGPHAAARSHLFSGARLSRL